REAGSPQFFPRHRVAAIHDVRVLARTIGLPSMLVAAARVDEALATARRTKAKDGHAGWLPTARAVSRGDLTRDRLESELAPSTVHVPVARGTGRQWHRLAPPTAASRPCQRTLGAGRCVPRDGAAHDNTCGGSAGRRPSPHASRTRCALP